MREPVEADLFKIEGAEWGVNRFPDGQVQFWMEPATGPVRLWASLPTSESLDLFLQMISRVRFDSVQINYLYGARSDKDRAGSREVANVARLVLDLIEAAAPGLGVTIVAPHCPELLTTQRATWPLHREILANEPGYDAILYPDASARARFQGVAPDLPWLECEKERDQVTGRIVRHAIPDISDYRRLLVLDDLCDGGRTFLDIASAIGNQVRLDLSVTHGVFSNGAIPRLLERYETIWVTNSLPSAARAASDRVRILDVWSF